MEVRWLHIKIREKAVADDYHEQRQQSSEKSKSYNEDRLFEQI